MFIKSFKNISKNNVNIAGDKGASLGEMTRAKIPVPPGFIILVEAFDKFLRQTDLAVEIASQVKQMNYGEIKI